MQLPLFRATLLKSRPSEEYTPYGSNILSNEESNSNAYGGDILIPPRPAKGHTLSILMTPTRSSTSIRDQAQYKQYRFIYAGSDLAKALPPYWATLHMSCPGEGKYGSNKGCNMRLCIYSPPYSWATLTPSCLKGTTTCRKSADISDVTSYVQNASRLGLAQIYDPTEPPPTKGVVCRLPTSAALPSPNATLSCNCPARAGTHSARLL